LKKKILAISNYGNFVGGGEHSFFNLISCIRNHFHPVVIVPENGSVGNRFQKQNIHTQVIPLSKIRPWLFPSIFKTVRRLIIVAKNAKISLLYANGSRPAFYGGIVGKALKIPVIWHCRIAEKDYGLDSVLSRLSNLIIVNSGVTARRFSEQIQCKIQIIYNGIDTQWLKEEGICRDHVQAPDGKILLVVARVSKCKRHDLALNAFEEIAGAHPDLHLVLIGAKDPFEDEWWNYLHNRTSDSPLAERIHWIGHVEDIRSWYRAASILLLPSDNESFGRVLVEAMACKVPVVATAAGGIPEIVRHGKDGILVPVGKSQEMANAIKQILKDDSIKTKMSQSAEERAKKFSHESHIRAIISTFEETLGIEQTIVHKQPPNNFITNNQ
jgi:glycosyltransferase involved in cell wall biosynthesis